MESREHKQWVKLVKKWQAHFRLLDWVFKIDTVDGRDAEDGDTAGKTTSQPAYKQATVTQFSDITRKITPEDLDKTACHEVAHVFWAELIIFIDQLIDQIPEAARPLAKRVNEEIFEKTTTRLTQVMVRMEQLAKSSKTKVP